VEGSAGGVQPCLVVVLPSWGVGAPGQCHVVVLRWGLAVASGLGSMGMGIGVVSACLAWSGPCWCGLSAPGRGDVACLGLLGQLGHVLCPGTGSGSCCGLFSVVCVVGCGASHGVLAIGVWVGVAVVVMG
jgi:hypothetical protein